MLLLFHTISANSRRVVKYEKIGQKNQLCEKYKILILIFTLPTIATVSSHNDDDSSYYFSSYTSGYRGYRSRTDILSIPRTINLTQTHLAAPAPPCNVVLGFYFCSMKIVLPFISSRQVGPWPAYFGCSVHGSFEAPGLGDMGGEGRRASESKRDQAGATLLGGVGAAPSCPSFIQAALS